MRTWLKYLWLLALPTALVLLVWGLHALLVAHGCH